VVETIKEAMERKQKAAEQATMVAGLVSEQANTLTTMLMGITSNELIPKQQRVQALIHVLKMISIKIFDNVVLEGSEIKLIDNYNKELREAWLNWLSHKAAREKKVEQSNEH